MVGSFLSPASMHTDFSVQADNSTTSAAPPTVTTRTYDVSARLQHLRNLLSSERHGDVEQARAMDALDREIEMQGEPLSSRLDRRRRELEAQTDENDILLTAESPTSSPSSLARSRRRAVPPSERLLRHRDRLYPTQDGPAETTAVIERPPPPIEPSEIAIQEYLEEAQVNREYRWRAKRRKLEDGTFEGEGKTFSYGYKGQVVPGSLDLELVSCDGGEYSEPNGGSSAPQHVLQNDTSVYSTQSNKCNMLLKHVGGMPISLTRVIIKAPDNGYDAPIQEGMIFVAMDEDRLLEKTEQYEIRYSPRSYRYHHRRPDHHDFQSRPSHEYLNSTRPPLRPIDRSSYLRDPYPPFESDEADRLLETALMPGWIPGSNVTTSYDDSSDPLVNAEQISWPRHAPTFPRFNFDPSRLLRTYVDDHYRPTYDRIAFSDGTATSSESENDDSISDHNQEETPRSPADVHPSSRRRAPEHERLLIRSSSLTRPISRHGIPPREIAEANPPMTRTRQLINRLRMQHVRGSRDGDHWNAWTRQYLQMEMELGHITNRRSTPSRIEIRDATPGSTSVLEEHQPAAARDRADEATTSANLSRPPGPETHTNATSTSVQLSDPATPTTAKPSQIRASACSSPPRPLAPHARFFIRRDKSAVSINFDPPVAGRYILIKLWAPCPNANIDIQSIVAHGYGGPRFFPSQEFR